MSRTISFGAALTALVLIPLLGVLWLLVRDWLAIRRERRTLARRLAELRAERRRLDWDTLLGEELTDAPEDLTDAPPPLRDEMHRVRPDDAA